MAVFTYKAIGRNGEMIEGKENVPDRFVLYRKIKSDGHFVVSVKEETAVKTKVVGKLNSLFGRVKMQEKINFARNLGSMVEAGLAVTRALTVMEKQTKNKKLKKLLQDLMESVSKGKTLSESLSSYKKVFSPLFISMVKAGEESGNLPNSLKTIALQMEKSHAIVKKVRGAMLYPAVIIFLMIVIGILMMVYMVPTLSETFKGLGVELPLPTRVIIFISDFLRANFLLFFASILGVAGAIVAFARSKSGSRFFNRITIKIPVIGELLKQVNSARTARTLSSLISSGVDIVVALGVTQEVLQNVFYKEVLDKAQKSVEKGDPMSAVFVANENLYPIFVGEMMSVGEETGQMSEMLLNVAVFYENEVDQKTKDLSTIIEPILMIIIGSAVGLFAISMLAPTYSLVEKI